MSSRPTTDIRPHAEMTMPLSSTRSSTSMNVPSCPGTVLWIAIRRSPGPTFRLPVSSGRASHLPLPVLLPALYRSVGLWPHSIPSHLPKLHEVLEDLAAAEL